LEEKKQIEEDKKKLSEIQSKQQQQKANKYKMQEELSVQMKYIQELEQKHADNQAQYEALRKENEALKVQQQ